MLRGVAIAGLVGTLTISLTALALRGADGGASALLGALLAFGVILLGLVAIRAVLAGDAGISMAGAFVVYLGQLMLLAAAILVLAEQPWLEGPVLAVAVVVQTVLLQVGQIHGYVRSRHVLYPESGPA